MYKGKKVLPNLIILFFILLVSLLYGCNKENKFKKNESFYRAINGNDTAFLSLSLTKKHFTGKYEIQYGTVGKDSGDVRGDIKGDTFRGDFHFISNGGSWKRVPLALLRKENKLVLGNGVVGTYMNLPCFLPGTIDYKNSKFTFEEVE